MGEEEDRRIIEYFVVAGLGADAQELTAGAEECGCKNLTPQAPVTDICIIFPSLGEQVNREGAGNVLERVLWVLCGSVEVFVGFYVVCLVLLLRTYRKLREL